MAVTPMLMMSFKIHPKMRAYIDTMAEEDQIGLSEAIRELLQAGINEREAQKARKLPTAA